MATTKNRSGNKGATKRSGKGASGGSGRGKSPGGSRGGSSQMTTDVEEIRRIVEEKGGRPACVKGTEGRGGSCLLRIDFPGGAGEEKLQPMDWKEFNEVFEQNDLAMVYDAKPNVRFTKFVSRGNAKGASGNGSGGRGGSKGASRGGGRSKSAGAGGSARASRSQPGEKQRGRATGKSGASAKGGASSSRRAGSRR